MARGSFLEIGQRLLLPSKNAAVEIGIRSASIAKRRKQVTVALIISFLDYWT